MLKQTDSDDLVFTVHTLLDKAEFMERFIDGVRKKLDLPVSCEDDEVITRLGRIVGNFTEDVGESATSGA